MHDLQLAFNVQGLGLRNICVNLYVVDQQLKPALHVCMCMVSNRLSDVGSEKRARRAVASRASVERKKAERREIEWGG